ncbi:MAG TPA: LacI family DNA-binding transcriptional regulator [Advenella sp.]|nr:LacI family DNA-binding transcriptional regulator [Advenella sp.]
MKKKERNEAAGSRVTLLDIAAATGYSRATISLVMRNSPLVAEDTRKRVEQAAAELGYIYNRGAASLRSQKSHIVGVSITDLTNPYFAELTAAAEEGLLKVGRMALLSHNSESVEKQASFINTMREYNVDGLLLCPAINTPVAAIRSLNQLRIPFVFLSRYVKGVKADFVGNDNHKGLYLATSHLLSQGHRRVAMVCSNELTSTGRERLSGYIQALQDNGLAVDQNLIYEAAPTRKNGYLAIGNLLKMKSPPTAAVCFNDVSAFGVMLGLQHAGLQAGQDFAVFGHDNISEAGLWLPGLSSVGIEVSEMGRYAAEVLLERINHPDRPTQRVVLSPKLILRESSKCSR